MASCQQQAVARPQMKKKIFKKIFTKQSVKDGKKCWAFA